MLFPVAVPPFAAGIWCALFQGKVRRAASWATRQGAADVSGAASHVAVLDTRLPAAAILLKLLTTLTAALHCAAGSHDGGGPPDAGCAHPAHGAGALHAGESQG